jgi:hypothetical protein
MAKRDQPFKRLITLIGREFAAWVLNMDVRSVKLLSSEHTAIPAPIPSDLLFEGDAGRWSHGVDARRNHL